MKAEINLTKNEILDILTTHFRLMLNQLCAVVTDIETNYSGVRITISTIKTKEGGDEQEN